MGDIYSAAFTSANFNWLCSPAATELETIMMDWLCQLLGLPPCYLSTSPSGGGGVIHGSASEAIVTVVVAARDRALKELMADVSEDDDRREALLVAYKNRLVAICSDQSHSSTQKGCLIAGTRYRPVAVPRDPRKGNYGLTAATLRAALDAAVADGLVPFYTTVTLGTTSTCAADDFAAIAEIKRDFPNLWIHVDSAYAGAALVCPEYQYYIRGIEAFDSFNTNMHKWLLVNFDCSCLFVRERRHLADALSITPSYLRNRFSERGLVTDYRDWQIPLGRRFRALKVWFVMRTYGADGMRAHIRHSVAIGQVFYRRVLSRPDLFEVFTTPAFGLTVFTVNPVSPGGGKRKVVAAAAGGNKERNETTRAVYEGVNADGHIYITSTVVDGTYAIRVISGNPRADESHLERAFDIIAAKAEEVRAKLAD